MTAETDLASRWLGGSVVAASDESFAQREQSRRERLTSFGTASEEGITRAGRVRLSCAYARKHVACPCHAQYPTAADVVLRRRVNCVAGEYAARHQRYDNTIDRPIFAGAKIFSGLFQ